MDEWMRGQLEEGKVTWLHCCTVACFHRRCPIRARGLFVDLLRKQLSNVGEKEGLHGKSSRKARESPHTLMEIRRGAWLAALIVQSFAPKSRSVCGGLVSPQETAASVLLKENAESARDMARDMLLSPNPRP
eukprot:1048551-Rhodomonas_salina.2